MPKNEDFPETGIKNGEDDQINYYNEYCRLYLANSVLATELKELNLQKNDLVAKLTKLEVSQYRYRKKPKNSPKATAGN